MYQQDLAYIQAAGFGGLACGAAPEIIRRLRNASIPIRRVIDAGCGAGPLTEALVAAGFDVTGIDSSPELLAIARTAVPTAHFIGASIYDVEIPPCEAIVALGEPLTYHPEGTNAERMIGGFFQSASAALPPGGILIFDIIERAEPPLSGRTWSSGNDWAVMVETTESQASHTLVRAIETFRSVGALYRRSSEVHRVHLFDTQSLWGELASRGFEVETAQTYGTQALGPRRRAFFAIRSDAIVDT